MRVDEFDYDLPEELIALRPLERREEARLLVVRGRDLDDRQIRDLPELVEPGDLLVVNNTKVIPAFLHGQRPPRADGGNTESVGIDLTLVRQIAPLRWQALARPAKRLRPGDRVYISPDFDARIDEKGADGSVVITFGCAADELSALLVKHGKMPLPPYISSRRNIDDRDRDDYQTTYAKVEGAAAAPTAGLHLTEDLMTRLRGRGVTVAEVTLHVGLGTFLPVKVDDTEQHVMHSEWGEIGTQTARQIETTKAQGGRVIAVGTTSLRLLEAAAQGTGVVNPFRGETDLFITPGFRFEVVDRLLTNFHLPRSTLFMLVSAFSGQGVMKAAYGHAIAAKYRFYSYGDACLLTRCELQPRAP